MPRLPRQGVVNNRLRYYAVVDTNVLVSALLSKKDDAATVQVFQRILAGDVIPLYSNETMAEYREVLARRKFKFERALIDYVLSAIEKFGIMVTPSPTGTILPDMDDLPFYEIVMERIENNPYLVTGNIKHFPNERFVVTPSEFLAIINN